MTDGKALRSKRVSELQLLGQLWPQRLSQLSFVYSATMLSEASMFVHRCLRQDKTPGKVFNRPNVAHKA